VPVKCFYTLMKRAWHFLSNFVPITAITYDVALWNVSVFKLNISFEAFVKSCLKIHEYFFFSAASGGMRAEGEAGRDGPSPRIHFPAPYRRHRTPQDRNHGPRIRRKHGQYHSITWNVRMKRLRPFLRISFPRRDLKILLKISWLYLAARRNQPTVPPSHAEQVTVVLSRSLWRSKWCIRSGKTSFVSLSYYLDNIFGKIQHLGIFPTFAMFFPLRARVVPSVQIKVPDQRYPLLRLLPRRSYF